MSLSNLVTKKDLDELDDWEAVAKFTGCEKMYGAQGRAPSIKEMIEHLTNNIHRTIRNSDEYDLEKLDIESLIGSLILRCNNNRAREE